MDIRSKQPAIHSVVVLQRGWVNKGMQWLHSLNRTLAAHPRCDTTSGAAG